MKLVLNILFKVIRFFMFSIALSFLFTSCGRSIYTSAAYGSIKSYTPKQEYREQDTSAVYISGSISSGAHEPLGNIKDKKTIVSSKVHKSVTRKYYNLHYGIGASFGTYKFGSSFEDVISKNEKKAFYTVDAKMGINFNLPAKRVDWRLLGFELAYNYEFGPFQDKLKEIKENTSALVINRQSIFSYNFNMEVVFKLPNFNALGFGLFLGDHIDGSNDENSLIDSSFLGASISFKTKKFTFSYLVEDHWGLNDNRSSHTFGLSYQLF